MDFICEISLSDIITWIITILGILFAICQFNIQMKKDRENRNKENKVTWFLNVIVYPHLEKIHNFYTDILSKVQESKFRLTQKKNLPHKEYINEVGIEEKLIKSAISDFFDYFNPIISSYSKLLGNEIQNIKNNLQDTCTKYIEEEDINDNKKIQIDICNNKQLLLQTLNSELSINKADEIKK